MNTTDTQRRVDDRGGSTQPAAAAHHKPRLTRLLESLRLDKSYHRADGDHLYYRDPDGTEVAVLDCAGGYGSLLLGHAHPELVAEATRVLAQGLPIHAQGSPGRLTEQLAETLSRRCGADYCVVFANSGAEAVEAAMKHAMLETGGRTFIALEKAFHGKSLGAVQLTAHPDYRARFECPGVRVIRLPLNNCEHLEAAFAEADDLAGFIFEPVQGEGGVREMEREFAQLAAALCRKHRVPLMADECQTGLGRTGTFLASEALGLQPDYILLSKALGGGIAKIAALLVRRNQYQEAFDLKHSGTFAADDFSNAVALRTLELINDRFIRVCGAKGAQLLRELRELAEAYPDVVRDVRGRGLMIGIEFQRMDRCSSFLLRCLSSQGRLAAFLTAYLLNIHRIRVAPLLSDPLTLRLEPSALISPDAIADLVAALNDLCQRLRRRDSIGLSRFLAADGRPERDGGPCFTGRESYWDEHRFYIREQNVPATRVAWLCHLIDGNDLPKLDPALGGLSVPDRERLVRRVAPVSAPVVMSSVDVRSSSGQSVRLHPIMLPFTSGHVKELMVTGALQLPRLLVQEGVNLAQSLGCSMVSLGQYTSIITGNGLRVKPCATGLTSGNSYAVALAIDAIRRAMREANLVPGQSTLAVVGAGGNIGRTCATILADEFREVLLIGSDRPGAWRHLIDLAGALANARISTDPARAARAQVVICATNTATPILCPHHFARDAVVCDVSIPPSVSNAVPAERPDLCLIKGGIVALPGGEDLEIEGFPLPRGRTYGCMAEGILLGLEGITTREFTGRLTPEHVLRVQAMADRHGFRLADYKTACVLRAAPASTESKLPAHHVS